MTTGRCLQEIPASAGMTKWGNGMTKRRDEMTKWAQTKKSCSSCNLENPDSDKYSKENHSLHFNQINHSSDNKIVLNQDFNKIKRLPRFFLNPVHLLILKILIQTKREIITSKPQPKSPPSGDLGGLKS